MGRKRNQGKARKAAKAKAKVEAEDVQQRSNNNDQMTSGRQQSLAAQTQQLQVGNAWPHDTTKCSHMFHGFDPLSVEDICFHYAKAFSDAYYYEASIDGGADILGCLIAAKNATKDRFAEVSNNSAKMEIVISYYLSNGTQHILEGNYDAARALAIFARYLEQCTAVGLKQTQALVNFPKIDEASGIQALKTQEGTEKEKKWSNAAFIATNNHITTSALVNSSWKLTLLTADCLENGPIDCLPVIIVVQLGRKSTEFRGCERMWRE
eukprot:scaffold2899_cov85-Skeletonema_dohrnii-CCMP3373.AAC.5